MKEMIRLVGITKEFDHNLIIPTLNLTIGDGEFVTLLGPSGCGKTTILRMIAGLETPTSGQIFLDNEDVTKLAPYKRNVNMVFQHYALFPHMNVEENIRFGLMMKKVPKEEQDKRINQVLYLTQLEELRYRKPQQMSGGQQQRVAIARAVVNNPKVLLLDEPLGALDYKLRKKMQLELKNLQRGLGITFIYVTHDQEEALTMSDRVIIVNGGRIEQDDPPAKIYQNPKSQFAANFIGENNFFAIENDPDHVLAIRPQYINVTEEEAAAETAPFYYGTVVEILFTGTITKVYIRLDNTNQMVTAYQFYDDRKRWKADDRVGISWNEKDAVKVIK
ncbi:MAG: ABC transporter ATP-binding protein [Acidaminococcus sp.]|jgi:spermidine/putrescine transport system ATP-binding protein|nr:ABC transporter ATP-binding protein [Acidaminococcus sp.]MCI2100678.1 ABC transporter ATP-binding protein [Acidaminococcus sp.]MCI2114999.1 ABC transporter ATP-binding protein [Acidaminococcus sp.]MCI2117442.1 ABC transporter ATP-binding protein [Acidaminococcus sp.]